MFIINKLPVFAEKYASYRYDCGDGAAMSVYENIDKEDFLQYEQLLEKSGFLCYDRHDIAGNVHFTLTGKEVLVQLYYIEKESTVRLIADPNMNLYGKEKYSGAKICHTELFQFETDHSLIDCGMCYIARCADNSFFIIDSAQFYSVHDNDRIHDFLRSMTPDGERIRIAGWFLSHGHEDHYSKFKDYLLYNMEDTDIDCIYMNLIPTDHRDNANWMDSNKIMLDRFRAVVEECGIPVVKLHTGQRFFVKNLEFEVLCTHEDVFPASCANFNDSSTILMMTAEGTRVLFPGDAGEEESLILESRYGSLLKCDIVQLAHHGHFGTTENFYRLANAPTVLCPNTQIKFDEEFHRYKANETAHALASEFFISANGTVGLPLPYKTGEAEIFPDETTEDFDGIRQLWNYTYTDEFKEKHYAAFLKRGGKR